MKTCPTCKGDNIVYTHEESDIMKCLQCGATFREGSGQVKEPIRVGEVSSYDSPRDHFLPDLEIMIDTYLLNMAEYGIESTKGSIVRYIKGDIRTNIIKDFAAHVRLVLDEYVVYLLADKSLDADTRRIRKQTIEEVRRMLK